MRFAGQIREDVAGALTSRKFKLPAPQWGSHSLEWERNAYRDAVSKGLRDSWPYMKNTIDIRVSNHHTV